MCLSFSLFFQDGFPLLEGFRAISDPGSQSSQEFFLKFLCPMGRYSVFSRLNFAVDALQNLFIMFSRILWSSYLHRQTSVSSTKRVTISLSILPGIFIPFRVFVFLFVYQAHYPSGEDFVFYSVFFYILYDHCQDVYYIWVFIFLFIHREIDESITQD